MSKLALDACEDLAYTQQLFTLTRQGHTIPTAQLGAPAVVWHVAFWPRREFDPHDINMTALLEQLEKDPQFDFGKDIRDTFKTRSKFLSADFDSFLRQLQRFGQPGSSPGTSEVFAYEEPLDWDVQGQEPFAELNAEATGFTLWLPDKWDATKEPTGWQSSPPDKTALRIRVEAQMNSDFSTFTMIVDAGKPWDREPVYSLEEVQKNALGERRGEIFRHVEEIKRICEERVNSPTANRDLLPEDLGQLAKDDPAHTEKARILKDAADYLYETLWAEICDYFRFNLTNIAGNSDDVFANFRGLLLSSRGADREAPPEPGGTANRGQEPFARFKGRGSGYETDSTEPNQLIKAYIPLLRRIRSESDWRDWIACGIFDWRAIYITPLGAQSRFHDLEEGRVETMIPAGHLPSRRRLEPGMVPAGQLSECQVFGRGRIAPSTHQKDRPAPFRYLVIHKHEPNRRQIGRMIERINSLGAYRLYALKNWTVIRQAGVWVRIYGQKLDAAYQRWITRTNTVINSSRTKEEASWRLVCSEIESLSKQAGREEALVAYSQVTYSAERAVADLFELHDRFVKIDKCAWKRLAVMLASMRDAKESRDIELAKLNQMTERILVRITSDLDDLGRAAIGGLPYRVSRSRYYADLYRDAVKTLRVGNIETWWSYEQFARRGMEPALRFIAAVGDRLDKLRERLQRVKEDILQSSINYQTEATRDNTHKLERIQKSMKELTRVTADAAVLAEKAGIRADRWKWIYYITAVVFGVVIFAMQFWLAWRQIRGR